MTVNANPASPSASSNSPVTSGNNLDLTAGTVSGSTYRWTGPNNYNSTVQNPVIVAATSAMTGTYYVQAVSTLGCASALDSVVVVVANMATLAGKVESETGSGIQRTTVSAFGSTNYSFNTDTSGNYNFSLVAGTNYYVKPQKNNDSLPSNGVTSLDYLLIQRHILGVSFLTSPYKIIAADVNNSGSVTSLDLLYIRSLILGNISTFPGGRLWAFVPSNYVFSNPQLPFPFPDSLSYSAVSSQSGQNFIGVKLGDVNNSWNPLVAGPLRNNAVSMNLPVLAAAPGTQISVPVTADKFKNISAVQGTVEWDASKLEYVTLDSLQGALKGIEYGATQASAGKLAFAWTNPEYSSTTMPDGNVLFNVIYRVRGEAGTASPVSITSEMTPVEVVDNDLNVLNYTVTAGEVKIETAEDIAELVAKGLPVVSTGPNPFNGTVKLNFELFAPAFVSVEIYDELGSKVEQYNGLFDAGKHNKYFGNNWAEGAYFIRFTAGDYSQTFKVINIGN